MTMFEVVGPVCVALALALSGCVVDTSESDVLDEDRAGEAVLPLDSTAGDVQDDSSNDERGTVDDGSSTDSQAGAVAVPHAEPDPEPWDPGSGHGSDDA